VTSEPAPAANPFGTLLAVQDLDTAIAQHEHRKATLPERAELEELQHRAVALRREAAGLTTQHDELAARTDRLEEQTAAAVSRRKTLEDRMYNARGAASRDLAAIEGEVAQLAERLGRLEDDELALLEEQEPIDQALTKAETRLAAMAERGAALVQAVAQADREIDDELADLRARRTERAAGLPADLAARYERLRTHLGTGAARLIGDRCDGCHLTLSAVEMDRFRHLPDDALITCDQCGRILVRGSLAET
jgi:hypothetical protein